MSVASERALAEWRARIAAEYTSATLTQSLVLWMMQAGGPPDVIDAGLVIVSDELVHSRMSHDVYVAAGGVEAPVLRRDRLGVERREAILEADILRTSVRSFCLGETIAVPLFRRLRERCTVPVAREALDRILRDEVRHRDFGWDVLDWLCATDPSVPARVTAMLPRMLADLEASYGGKNVVISSDDGAMSDDDRAWGLAPPREYAEIFERTIDREYRPRFDARGISLAR
ncbi:hypothetical protein BH09MYX1_BH09MYX1_52680 [soil metagenome]